MSETERLTGGEWQWKRREVIIRDEYECRACGAPGAWKGSAELEVHHVEHVAVGGGHTIDNLKTLCSDCHRNIHTHSTDSDDRSEKCDTPIPNEERNAKSGQFAEKYDTETFLDALRECEGAASTAEVADQVGCPRRTAYGRLDGLHEAGKIEKRAVGAGVLWMLSEGETT